MLGKAQMGGGSFATSHRNEDLSDGKLNVRLLAHVPADAAVEDEAPDGTMYLDVLPHQLAAAHALVSYISTGGRLKDDLTLGQIAQLHLLSEKYAVPNCMRDCVGCLLRAMPSVEAVLHACRVVGDLGAGSPASQDLLAAFTELSDDIRAALSTLGGSAGAQLPHAVQVLRGVFQDLDAAWAQQEALRHILHLFPWQALHGLLSWDGLVCASENLVPTITQTWLEAQPEPPDGAALEQLLRCVRVPHLTPSYLTQVFPCLPWVACCAEGPDLARLGTLAALAGQERFSDLYCTNTSGASTSTSTSIGTSTNASIGSVGGSSLGARLGRPALPRPRLYRPASNLQQLHWELPWRQVSAALAAARASHRRLQQAVLCRGEARWANGVCVVLSARVSLLAPRQPAIVCNWAWHLGASAGATHALRTAGYAGHLAARRLLVRYQASAHVAEAHVADAHVAEATTAASHGNGNGGLPAGLGTAPPSPAPSSPCSCSSRSSSTASSLPSVLSSGSPSAHSSASSSPCLAAAARWVADPGAALSPRKSPAWSPLQSPLRTPWRAPATPAAGAPATLAAATQAAATDAAATHAAVTPAAATPAAAMPGACPASPGAAPGQVAATATGATPAADGLAGRPAASAQDPGRQADMPAVDCAPQMGKPVSEAVAAQLPANPAATEVAGGDEAMTAQPPATAVVPPELTQHIGAQTVREAAAQPASTGLHAMQVADAPSSPIMEPSAPQAELAQGGLHVLPSQGTFGADSAVEHGAAAILLCAGRPDCHVQQGATMAGSCPVARAAAALAQADKVAQVVGPGAELPSQPAHEASGAPAAACLAGRLAASTDAQRGAPAAQARLPVLSALPAITRSPLLSGAFACDDPYGWAFHVPLPENAEQLAMEGARLKLLLRLGIC